MMVSGRSPTLIIAFVWCISSRRFSIVFSITKLVRIFFAVCSVFTNEYWSKSFISLFICCADSVINRRYSITSALSVLVNFCCNNCEKPMIERRGSRRSCEATYAKFSSSRFEDMYFYTS